MKKILSLILISTLCFSSYAQTEVGADRIKKGSGVFADANNALAVVGVNSNVVVTVRMATTAALTGTWVYNNGASGVGATLTRAAAGALAAIDGVTPVANDLLLVKDQSTQANNGVYVITTLGDGGTATVLTRTTNSDATAELDNQAVKPTLGTTNGTLLFRQTTAIPTVGSSNIVYTDISGLFHTQILLQDEGSGLGTTGTVSDIDFTGGGVTANRTGNKITVSIPGGGSSALLLGRTNYVSSAGAGGSYEDLGDHYISGDAAITAMGDGDMVVFLPGSYTITSAAIFQQTTNIYCYPGAIITFDNTIADSTCVTLNISGSGNINFSAFSVTNFAALQSINIQATSVSMDAPNIDFVDCYITINCTGDFLSDVITFPNGSGSAYTKFSIEAHIIDVGSIIHDESNYSIFLNPRSNIVKGYVQIFSSTNKLWDIVINGDLQHFLVPANPALSINGNCWFNSYTNFNGLQINGNILTNSNEPAVDISGTSRLSLSCGIKHSISDAVTFPDVPAVRINADGNCLVVLEPANGYSIASFNSDGTSGVVFSDNNTVTHTIIADGKFLNLNADGDVFGASNATQQLILGNVRSNINVDGTNTNIQSGTTTVDAALN